MLWNLPATMWLVGHLKWQEMWVFWPSHSSNSVPLSFLTCLLPQMSTMKGLASHACFSLNLGVNCSSYEGAQKQLHLNGILVKDIQLFIWLHLLFISLQTTGDPATHLLVTCQRMFQPPTCFPMENELHGGMRCTETSGSIETPCTQTLPPCYLYCCQFVEQKKNLSFLFSLCNFKLF